MRVNRCRICKNRRLVKIGSLGKIALSNFTDTPQESPKYPLELVYCEKCTLLQLAHNSPRDLLYKNYWYESGLNPVIVEDLKEIAKLCKGYVISIGENDGTLLKHVKSKVKIAVDPSNIKPQSGQWFNDYWENYNGDFQVHTIVAIACLYDLPDPNKFIKKVKDYLAEDGVFISQFQPLAEMVELNDIGNICHEHIEYYSYKSLVYLFELNGLEIYKVEKNKINGGSYRVFARRFREGSIEFKEKEYGVKELRDFFRRIEENKNRFLNWLVKNNPKITGYGASTKGGTITGYYKVSPHKTVDVNPRKLGKFAFGASKIVADIPKGTEYLWVFPYGFIDYFKKKEKDYKGKWITTIPMFLIL